MRKLPSKVALQYRESFHSYPIHVLEFSCIVHLHLSTFNPDVSSTQGQYSVCHAVCILPKLTPSPNWRLSNHCFKSSLGHVVGPSTSQCSSFMSDIRSHRCITPLVERARIAIRCTQGLPPETESAVSMSRMRQTGPSSSKVCEARGCCQHVRARNLDTRCRSCSLDRSNRGSTGVLKPVTAP